MFAISVLEADGRTVVVCRGEVDLVSTAEFRTVIGEQIVEGRVHLVIDLSEVSFLDSSGLGALVAARRKARAFKGSLVLVATHPTVLRLLRVTALDRVFAVHPTREAALSAPIPPPSAEVDVPEPA